MSESVYYGLHRLLFVAHVLLAAYVAGGTLWLWLHGLKAWLRPANTADEDPIAHVLRDWLPFVLGLAITFGIGPLLLVQLFDGHAFYTANLLLSHGFMAILPALIAGFYLLYLQKAKWPWVRSRPARVAIPLLAFACFGFTAFSWSANHLLAQDHTVWPERYRQGPGLYWHAELPLRLLTFAGFALQATTLLVAVQGRALRGDTTALRRLRTTTILGVALTLAGLLLHPAVPGVSLLGLDGALILLAELTVATAWLRAPLAGKPALLPIATVGVVLLAERLAALRESVRITRSATHELAANASTQGFAVFAASLLLVAAAITWSVWRVRRELLASAR